MKKSGSCQPLKKKGYDPGRQIYRQAGYSRTISGIFREQVYLHMRGDPSRNSINPAQVIRPGHHRHVSCRSTLISPGYDRIFFVHAGQVTITGYFPRPIKHNF
jgi:hypothetical protein